MAEEKEVVKQPWEELGFATFKEYDDKRQADFNAALDALKKPAEPAKPAETTKPVEPQKPVDTVDFKAKASEIYGRMTEEQKVEVNKLSDEITPEVRALIASSPEAKYNFLNEIVGENLQAKGLFDDLSSATPTKTVAEIIKESVVSVKGTAPNNDGNGYVPPGKKTNAEPYIPPAPRYSAVGGFAPRK